MTEQEIIKHTPGPWTYSGDEDGDFVIWGPGRDEFLANVDQEPFGPVPPMKIAFDINQANARLIASAPDMQVELSRLREGLRELAERHDGTAAELDAIFGKPWAKPLHEVTAIELKRDLLKMFAGEIRALLSLEGDKKGTQNGD